MALVYHPSRDFIIGGSVVKAGSIFEVEIVPDGAILVTIEQPHVELNPPAAEFDIEAVGNSIEAAAIVHPVKKTRKSRS